MDNFLAFSKKCISASAGVIPLIRKERVTTLLYFHLVRMKCFLLSSPLSNMQAPSEAPADLCLREEKE